MSAHLLEFDATSVKLCQPSHCQMCCVEVIISSLRELQLFIVLRTGFAIILRSFS